MTNVHTSILTKCLLLHRFSSLNLRHLVTLTILRTNSFSFSSRYDKNCSLMQIINFKQQIDQCDQLFNKMLGKGMNPHEQILRLPQPARQGNFLRMCTSQEQIRDCYNQEQPRRAIRPKISIKGLLRKQGFNPQQSAAITNKRGPPTQQSRVSYEMGTETNRLSLVRSPPKVQNIQNRNAYNYIFGEYIIQPQQIRIIYQTAPTQPAKQPPATNIAHQNHKSSVSKQVVPDEKSKQQQQKESFNQFMSFGPKHFDLFKKMEHLQINDMTSQIVEETERTEGMQRRDLPIKKRLTKTFSEVNLQNQRDNFSASQLCVGNDRVYIPRSSLFKSIKKTETMGMDDNSDHQSEVVEKFQSLMEKIRQNRLDNSCNQF